MIKKGDKVTFYESDIVVLMTDEKEGVIISEHERGTSVHLSDGILYPYEDFTDNIGIGPSILDETYEMSITHVLKKGDILASKADRTYVLVTYVDKLKKQFSGVIMSKKNRGDKVFRAKIKDYYLLFSTTED